MKKFNKFCSDCKLQKKSSNCQDCHDYWVDKYDLMYLSQASAQGKNGAEESKRLAAEKKAKEIYTRFLDKTLELGEERTRNEQLVHSNNTLKQTIASAVAKIQISTLFDRRKTLQDVWHMLTDSLHGWQKWSVKK